MGMSAVILLAAPPSSRPSGVCSDGSTTESHRPVDQSSARRHGARLLAGLNVPLQTDAPAFQAGVIRIQDAALATTPCDRVSRRKPGLS
jgi:hypothetical protein